MYHQRLHWIWKDMIRRCENKKCEITAQKDFKRFQGTSLPPQHKI